jgi:ABC-type phosphate/phosphonate transport system substrate-binding protein
MTRRFWLIAAVAAVSYAFAPATRAEEKSKELVLVVMDPLSAPLSCDCVKGYAQRKYEQLGLYLTAKMGRPVKVYWSESLPQALKDKTSGRADLIIGKHSVVLSDAKLASLTLKPIAALTGKDGTTIQTGLIVVRAADKAKSAGDLAGYRIFFGPAECDEKSAAPMKLLKDSGVALAAKPETYPACSDAAAALVELPADAKAAAVISSYAAPLLEGCGTVKKGDLRIVGESDAVPFITAFANTTLADDDRVALHKALLDVGSRAELLIALETQAGFVDWKEPAAKTVAKKKN